mmetsp:Transcript_28014/g.44576  ORF Transcript_28014/g.44576 Transcript_28014/m.44576 type:complete len:205 (-) Transcript_28014:1479-2093(-)
MDDPGGLDTVEMNGALGFGLGVDMNGVLGFGLGVLIVGWNLGAVNLGAVVVDIVSGPVVILDSVSGGVVESDLDTVVGGFVIGVAVLDSGFDAGSGLGWACSAETSSRVERNMSLSFWGVFLKLRGVSTYGLFGSGYACLVIGDSDTGVADSDLNTAASGFAFGAAVSDSIFGIGSLGSGSVDAGGACSPETSSRVERNMSLSF